LAIAGSKELRREPQQAFCAYHQEPLALQFTSDVEVEASRGRRAS